MIKKYKAIVFGTKEIIAEAENFKECKEKALQNCGLNKFYYDCEEPENGTDTE
jgi:hypothetical protein